MIKGAAIVIGSIVGALAGIEPNELILMGGTFAMWLRLENRLSVLETLIKIKQKEKNESD